MSDKPNVFIASSVEGLSVAEAVNIKMEYDAQVKQWDNAFDLSSVTITSLIKRAKETEFGIFVFHPDDKTIIRENEYSTVRDNVLFELGLFIGSLGIERCFVLIPKSKETEFRLPADLAGVTTTSYDDQLEDKVDAVATSCAKIKQAIKKIRNSEIEVVSEPEAERLKKQLADVQSQLWMQNHEIQRAREEASTLLSSIMSYFHAVAKPATEAEIVAWEEGAKSSYLKDIKISRRNVFYVDKEIVIPPLAGASSISVIVAEGVRVHGANRRSHNSIYYMDGFRTDARV
ncbi:TIR domain-containing protein [Kangiella koreensis]|uniref:Nucleotide-binding protein containing TIR-like domain n=1 Tax=Kangiella koreensis (strain DSM 16069 / JCM 12317 / KCTC 12182 / SW-125) TaxID=523791 RepID=C7R666_KANKD|nr:nucleotide-binding protein [Kangiella koreensis]ACV25497.1 nucleotide-binding protein containing TIR-like domain [Kangiella koreensis DSM 16069]